MRWTHAGRPGRAVRLGVCMNLWPTEGARDALAGLRAVAAPLAREVAPGIASDVGLFLPARAARELRAPAGRPLLAELVQLLASERLSAFSWNAFPFGGFHRAGLKAAVFEPGWADPARLAYTLDVAELAIELAPRREREERREHVSISTHTGRHGPWKPGEERLAIGNLARCALELARLERERGRRVVLALEPEPRASSATASELAGFLARVRERAAEALGASPGPGTELERALARHLGTCLDACHAAVEFEPAAEALEAATAGGSPLGKLQFSSALRLRSPGSLQEGRRRLFALAEPIFLHQVTGRRGAELLRAGDLPELEGHCRGPEHEPGAGWLAAEEWRCHFHVPVDLGKSGGLETTRDEAGLLLAEALAHPERWGTDELHVEIETYTWTVLAARPPSPSELVSGLAREHAFVRKLLRKAGWRAIDSPGASQ